MFTVILPWLHVLLKSLRSLASSTSQFIDIVTVKPLCGLDVLGWYG